MLVTSYLRKKITKVKIIVGWISERKKEMQKGKKRGKNKICVS